MKYRTLEQKPLTKILEYLYGLTFDYYVRKELMRPLPANKTLDALRRTHKRSNG